MNVSLRLLICGLVCACLCAAVEDDGSSDADSDSDSDATTTTTEKHIFIYNIYNNVATSNVVNTNNVAGQTVVPQERTGVPQERKATVQMQNAQRRPYAFTGCCYALDSRTRQYVCGKGEAYYEGNGWYFRHSLGGDPSLRLTKSGCFPGINACKLNGPHELCLCVPDGHGGWNCNLSWGQEQSAIPQEPSGNPQRQIADPQGPSAHHQQYAFNGCCYAFDPTTRQYPCGRGEAYYGANGWYFRHSLGNNPSLQLTKSGCFPGRNACKFSGTSEQCLCVPDGKGGWNCNQSWSQG